MTPGQELLREWRNDPRKFAWDCFKFVPDAWQEDVFDALIDPKAPRISMQACAGPGKTALLAIIILWFLVCLGQNGMHPKGAAVSVTHQNLKDNLWPEISKWMMKSEYIRTKFTWTKARVYCNAHPETWFMSARSWDKKASADEQGRTMSGLHSEYVLVIVDESGEIPLAVLKTAEQAIGGKHAKFGKILQAGNPSSLNGMLYAAANTLSHLWRIIRITGDPDDPKRSPRIDLAWAKEQIATYGRDNPWVMSYILGKFPPSSLNALLGPDEVRDAMLRHVDLNAYKKIQKRIGVDVARFGDDRSVLFPRQGLWSGVPIVMKGASSDRVAARVIVAKDNYGSEVEFVDGTGGFGAGVIDQMRVGGYSPMEVNFSQAAINAKYFNKRAEMWFEMASWIKRGGRLAKNEAMVRELTAPQYFFHNGKLQLESKEQIKKRLGFSPDLGDALALTFALPDCPASLESLMGIKQLTGGMRSDYDLSSRYDS